MMRTSLAVFLLAACDALAIDTAFHDDRGGAGFDFGDRTWPHGWTGSAIAHGVVFSR
jgi:hypothetical protein